MVYPDAPRFVDVEDQHGTASTLGATEASLTVSQSVIMAEQPSLVYAAETRGLAEPPEFCPFIAQ